MKEIYLLIAPHYPPYKTSAANQLFDLNSCLIKKKNVIVITSTEFSTKKISNIHFINSKLSFSQKMSIRFFGEFSTPFRFILYTNKVLNSLFKNNKINVICYSPPVFNSIYLIWLKLKYEVKIYLILRDIFPRWLYDLKIIRKGLIYYFFYFFYYLQLRISDSIGIQSTSNRNFIPINIQKKKNIEVLFNWQNIIKPNPRFYKVISGYFKNSKILVYAGNVGIAQDYKFIIEIAKSIIKFKNFKILIFGRGTLFNELLCEAKKNNLNNIFIFNEIDRDEMNFILNKSYMGIITLDKRHNTHNIPGKFISYVQMELPCIANIKTSDLSRIIEFNNLGKCFDPDSLSGLDNYFSNLLNNNKQYLSYKKNIKKFKKNFSTIIAADQIINDFNH